MPDTNLAIRPVPAPTLSFFDRILGRTAPAAPVNDPNLPPNVIAGLKILQKEAPDIANVAIRNYGPIASTLPTTRAAQAFATMNPFNPNTIYLNPEQVKGLNEQDVADTLLHELTHVRQANERSVVERILQDFKQSGPYGQRPDELEAFQAEADRRTRMGRPAAYGTPHFLDDSQEQWGDRYLPPAKK